MIRYEISLPDASAESIQKVPPEEFSDLIARLVSIQNLNVRHSEARQRTVLFWYLLLAGSVILSVSLFLIVGQAVGKTHLPDSAIATLIGSVAVEFVGMLWLVVRYLFPAGSAG